MRRQSIAAVALLVGGLAMATEVVAQGPGGARRMGPNLDEQMAELTELLELNEEQTVQVREILEMQGERRREMFQNGGRGGDRSAMRAMMAELQEETNAQLAEVLSDAQMEEYESYVAERRQRRGPPPF